MRDLSILVLHCVCSFLGATRNLQRHIAILRTVISQIDFLLPSTIHLLRAEKKMTYLADT